MTAGAGAKVGGEARERLRRRLLALGFDEVRFVAAGGPNSSLRVWLAAGHHADMQWMEHTADKRMEASLVLPGVRSVIILGVNYWSGSTIENRESSPGGGWDEHRARSSAAAKAAGQTPGALRGATGSGQPGKIQNPLWARYALQQDYHDTIKPGLVAAGRVLEEMCGAAGEDYRYYVDTGPVLERGWAARSGLGFRGKNAMLISQRHGNWLFLASILTRVEITPDKPLRKNPLPEGDEPAGLLCGKCTRCLDACPTDAFPRPGVVDSRRCISYQTIENKGIIPRELRPGIGSRIYGCDVCLEVCPWNRFARAGRQMLLAARPAIAELPLREILELTPARFAEIFRGTTIKRLKLTGLLRNACVVAGNTGDASLLPVLGKLAVHEAPVVRAHAVWAVQRLAGREATGLLATPRDRETDRTVLAEYAAGRADP
jgi:epoxyqueuosine reductase